MPLTPFHLGPGALLKGCAPRKISFSAFLGAQIFMDTEVLWNILVGNVRLHTLFHSFVGSLIPCALTVIATRPILSASRRFVREFPRIEAGLTAESRQSWKVIIVSACIGVWSHVALDAQMHYDVTPFYPFSDMNPLRGFIPTQTLELLCVATGIFGAGLWYSRQLKG